jgi:hypothetical protein
MMVAHGALGEELSVAGRCRTGVRIVVAVATAVALVLPPAASAKFERAAASPRKAASRDQSICTAEATKALVRRFTTDYSSGRVSMINRLWAPALRFRCFSTGPPGARLGPRAYDRSTLAAYFRARVRLHERVRLTQLRAGYDPARQIVNFNGKLVRTAEDRPPPRAPQDFKGAADCVGGAPLLIVWSM